jgi:DNA-binding CsgD family transcriptional regulator
MPALRQRDLRSLVALLDSFVHTEADALPRRVVLGLHEIVPGLLSSYNEFGAGTTTLAAVEPHEAHRPAHEESFVRFAFQHPVLARLRGARSQPARAISDYATTRELERLDLYQELYRPLGIVDQISIAVAGPEGLTIGVAMSRERRGFSERDRLLLDLLRPHLIGGPIRIARDRLLRDAHTALEAASGVAPRRAVVVLAGSGRIAWATPQARQVLHDWFGYSGGSDLPARLADWVHAGCDRASRSAFELAPRALHLRWGERTLTATLLRPLEPDAELLLTLDQHAAPGGEHTARLGLTRRESEVLAAAARGLDEADIAQELAIARRTVNKHFEHIYRKLGVTDRAHAIVTALA